MEFGIFPRVHQAKLSFYKKTESLIMIPLIIIIISMLFVLSRECSFDHGAITVVLPTVAKTSARE